MSKSPSETKLTAKKILIGLSLSAIFLGLMIVELSKLFPQRQDNYGLTAEQLQQRQVRQLRQQQTNEEQNQRKLVQNWYEKQSHKTCEDEFKKNLRNPSSYSRDGDINIVGDDGMKKTIVWKYRAQNGFGGFNYAAVSCFIENKDNGRYKITPLG